MKNKPSFGSKKPGKFAPGRGKFGSKPAGAGRPGDQPYERKGPSSFKGGSRPPRFDKPGFAPSGFSKYKKPEHTEREPGEKSGYSSRPSSSYEKPYSPRKPGFSPRKPAFGARPGGSGKPGFGYQDKRRDDFSPRKEYSGSDSGYAPRSSGGPGSGYKSFGSGPGFRPRDNEGSAPRYKSSGPGQGYRPRDNEGSAPRYKSSGPGQGYRPRDNEGSAPRYKSSGTGQGYRPRDNEGTAPRYKSSGPGQGYRPRDNDGFAPRFKSSGAGQGYGSRDAEGTESRFKGPRTDYKDRPFRKSFDKPYSKPFSKPKPFNKPYENRPAYDQKPAADFGSEATSYTKDASDENFGITKPADSVKSESLAKSEYPPSSPGESLKGLKFAPGTTAKKLIVTLQDTRHVPTRLVWIYDTMVGALPDGEPQPGDTVHVHDAQDRFIGSAIYNPHSRIRARIFAVSKQLFGDAYIQAALETAVEFRRKLGMLKGSCRIVFGEADGLPGLIADKIGDYLVVQPLTFAVDRRITRIVDLLNELVCPQGIIIRNDVPIRAKEGLEVGEVVTHGEIPGTVKVKEDDCILFADPAGGQKTGLFLDQRLNRESIAPFAPGARVLDLFCHVGGWAMRAARYGAAEVIAVDSSKSALAMAELAAKENGFEQIRFEEADVFDYLRQLETEDAGLFDIIICDPPAFAKSKAHFEDAFRAYLSLNYLVMKKLKPGGILVTCSCSQAVSNSEFAEALLTAARNARMQFQIIEKRGAPQDHPVLLGLPESNYLKCFIMRRTE